MARLLSRRTSHVLLTLLAIFLLGTVIVLSSVRAYFSIDSTAYILPEELGTWEEIRWGATGEEALPLGWAARYPWLAKVLHRGKVTAALEAEQHAALSSAPARSTSVWQWNDSSPPEKIPRIIHQTWKDNVLPPKWQAIKDACVEMHPDYEYMLWTDADSRKFLVEHYPWFVPVFDAYPYPIQRADAIRYFVLHKYGGIYMDLDVGCLRRFDPLLRFEVILPKTIPVGVSNDVMLSAKGHPFMEQLIHNLVTFNHQYLTNYPTVMFSTGPMFVSASYGMYVSAHGPAIPSTPSLPDSGFTGIRVLPKSLYGKNAKPGEAPDAFFKHFYGSSWHANDAGFLIFLRDHGRLLMVVGACVVAYGAAKTILPRVMHAMGKRSASGRRGSRGGSGSNEGRWISLPVRSDGTRPSGSRRNARSGGAYEALPITPAALAGAPRVAAPKPQRFSLPMFDLADNDGSEEAQDETDSITSETANGAGPAAGLLSWVGSGFSRPSSSATEGDDLHRSGTASKSKMPRSGNAAGTLYLPAFFVGAPDGATSPESSTSGASWGRPHSRGSSLGTWAANLMPQGWRAASPAIGGRTPSPAGNDLDLESISSESVAPVGSGRFASTWTPASVSSPASKMTASSKGVMRPAAEGELPPPPYVAAASTSTLTAASELQAVDAARLNPSASSGASTSGAARRPGLTKRASRGTLRSTTPAVTLDNAAIEAQDAEGETSLASNAESETQGP